MNHLQRYQHQVWRLLNEFDSFNIIFVPRGQNQDVDLMENITSKLSPDENLKANKFPIELIFRPLIPNNITNQQVFKGDQQILQFFRFEKTFKDQIIDEEEHDEAIKEEALDMGNNHYNTTPKSIIRMEQLYDLHDKFKRVTNSKARSSSMQYEVVNLGSEQDP